MQSEIKKAVDQHGKTSGQARERNAPPEIIARLRALQSLVKKQRDKTERHHTADDTRVRKRLQVIVVRLFETKQAVARIIFCVNNAERAEPGADVGIRFDYVERD